MLFQNILLSLAILITVPVTALLEEKFIGFDNDKGALSLKGAPVIVDPDDFVGIHIAAESLAAEIFAVAGQHSEVVQYTSKRIVENASITHSTAIIVESATNSSLIQSLSRNGQLDISKIEGKWKSFMTSLVHAPFPGVNDALVIAGSDKRGKYSA